MKKLIIIMIIASGAFAINYHGIALAPDNLHGWAVRIDTPIVLNTTDGGMNWQGQSVPAGTKRFFDVTCTDQLTAWTCGILGEILHTDNGGLDWYGQVIGLAKYATRIEFIDPDYGWAACGDGTVGRTADGGSYWDQIFVQYPWDSAEFYGVCFLNEYDGWVVAGYADSMLTGQGLILKSTDGGIYWDSVYQVSNYEDFFDVHFFNLLDGVVIGGDEADSSAIIMRTTDGGANWNFVTPPANTYYIRAVDFVGSEGWAVGMLGTIIHTTNSGVSWTFQNNPATATLFDVDFSDNLHGLACGNTHLLYTTDGGANWTDVGVNEANIGSDIAAQLSVYPNPFSKTTNIRFQAPSSISQGSLRIYDVSGRKVKTFDLPTAYSLLPIQMVWNGTDDHGQALAPGIYVIRHSSVEYSVGQQVVLIE